MLKIGIVRVNVHPWDNVAPRALRRPRTRVEKRRRRGACYRSGGGEHIRLVVRQIFDRVRHRQVVDVIFGVIRKRKVEWRIGRIKGSIKWLELERA